jgi:myo-inositol-1(or 4)-monophosphatase
MAAVGRVMVSERRSTTERPYPDAVTDPEALLALAADAGRKAAALLAGAALDPAAIETKSSATDLVTDLDRTAERLIVDRLLADRPDDGVLGEEGGERAGTSGVRWVIDPLDGTTNFVYGFPAYAVAIAAEEGGELVAATVTDVGHDEQFTAVRGGGARRDGVPIAVSGLTSLATALVGTGFSYLPEVRRRQAEVLPHVLGAVRDVRRLGSAALDLCWVACGRLDGFWERGLAPWDHAAASLVAREAGARVGWLGEDTTTLVVAGPGIYRELEALLLDAGAVW